MTPRQQVLNHLDALGISYELTEHPQVFTIGEMKKLGLDQKGEICKNLFLRDAKGRRHFLITFPCEKQADLRSIAEQLGCTRLSFASAERLETYLGLHQGEVTPLGILNDREASVEVVLDRSLDSLPVVGIHPNENSSTVWLKPADIRRLVEANGNTLRLITL